MALTLPIRPTLDQLRAFATAPRVSRQSRVRPAWARYHGPARDVGTISLIVMHATAGDSATSSIDWLNRPNSDTPASYAYVIERDGTIYRMCPADRVAWHAGDSAWPNPSPWPPGNVYTDGVGRTHHRTVNGVALGIAWANRDDGVEPLTPAQIESGLWLCGVFVPTTRVTVPRIRGHYEVSPLRKPDPGPAIDMAVWRQLVQRYLTRGVE